MNTLQLPVSRVFVGRFPVAAAFLMGLAGCEPPGAGAAAGDCRGEACLHDAICRPGEASAQFQSQVPPPSLMTPWHHAKASVTFANCSGQAWTRGAFALRPAQVRDEKTWGAAHVELPVDVPAGRAITIPIELIAPAASGAYPFSWAVVHDGVEVFEEPSPTAMVQVLPVADCQAPGPPARFRSQVGPAEFVAAGSPLRASVTFANCGTDLWRKDGALRLHSRGAPESAWGPAEVPLPFDVPPAHEVTIPVEGTAPGTPGQYTFAWQLEAEGKWLSEAGPTLISTVLEGYACGAAGPPARFISQNAPGSLSPDEGADVSVRFGNCSGRTWDGGYALDSALADRARIWGAGPVSLPLPVGSGFSIDIPFHIRAPNAHGTYPYRFGIASPESTILDETTPALDVSVRCLPACGDHNCGGDGCGGSCGNCPNNWSCDGAHCQAPVAELSCANVQWWNRGINYAYVNQFNWHDTDLNVAGSTPVQLRHDSRLNRTGVYGWGYMPEFTDLVTGDQFKILHLRPQNQNATNVGQVYPMGFVVGLSGGDTFDTGLPKYSTGAHLCIQTIAPYRSAFPAGWDACR